MKCVSFVLHMFIHSNKKYLHHAMSFFWNVIISLCRPLLVCVLWPVAATCRSTWLSWVTGLSIPVWPATWLATPHGSLIWLSMVWFIHIHHSLSCGDKCIPEGAQESMDDVSICPLSGPYHPGRSPDSVSAHRQASGARVCSQWSAAASRNLEETRRHTGRKQPQVKPHVAQWWCHCCPFHRRNMRKLFSAFYWPNTQNNCQHLNPDHHYLLLTC